MVVLAAAIGLSAATPSAEAGMMFTSFLTGNQEIPIVVTEAVGTAELDLNVSQTRLTMDITLFGLDLDGARTPSIPEDDVTGLHIHRAPTGQNGGVVFGLIGPNNDLNADVVIDPVAGTVSSAWDLAEGNGTTLGAEVPDLLVGGLYFNVHTVGYPGGEIRGQIIPEPATLALLALAAPGLWRRRPGWR